MARSSDVRATAENAIATAVGAADLPLQDQALDAVTEAATNQATEAVVNIKEETTSGVENSANEIAENALPDDVTNAATLIAEAAIENLDLKSGTLDQLDVVSDAVADAVFDAFGGDEVQNALQPLDLNAEEETRLQNETAEVLASSLVTRSNEATLATVEELPSAVAETLLNRVTKRFSRTFNKVFTYVTTFLGFGSLITTFVVSGIATAFRRPLVKLESSSGRRLRYAVAAACTIEEVRLERPISPFRNVVSKGVPVNEAFPCFLGAGAGELEFQFSPSFKPTRTWNLQLLWLRLLSRDMHNFTYALRVNGRWQSYPIEWETASPAAKPADLKDKSQNTRHEPVDDSDDEGT